MSSSDALRACLFLLVVAAACISRSHFRSRNASVGHDLVWHSQEDKSFLAGSDHRPLRSVADARSFANEARDEAAYGGAGEHGAAWRGRDLLRRPSATRRSQNTSSGLQLVEQHLVDKLSASFDDVQSRRHGSDHSTSTSNDYHAFNDSRLDTYDKLQSRRSLGMLDLPSLESLGLDMSESTSPWALQEHFPPAQLRPY